jgi:hypothetical protein
MNFRRAESTDAGALAAFDSLAGNAEASETGSFCCRWQMFGRGFRWDGSACTVSGYEIRRKQLVLTRKSS